MMKKNSYLKVDLEQFYQLLCFSDHWFLRNQTNEIFLSFLFTLACASGNIGVPTAPRLTFLKEYHHVTWWTGQVSSGPSTAGSHSEAELLFLSFTFYLFSRQIPTFTFITASLMILTWAFVGGLSEMCCWQ